MEEMEYPIRINRYLAVKQYASRREADRLIEDGQVRINGKVASLGDKVQKGDSVEVGAGAKALAKKRVYLAFCKPEGVVTHSPERGQKSIADILDYEGRMFPIGRLDMDSRGLIILTNDGRITDKLLNPEGAHEKEYLVRVDKPVNPEFIASMAKGVLLDDGYKTRKCVVESTGSKQFRITLTEGKKRQIRRMCEALGYAVTDLLRIRIMNIRLRELRAGEYRQLVGAELQTFLKSIGINQ
ncbi:MAG: Ribosomal large subunit pseudouridine synthase F [Candidatus Wolfebacteria bacterium GW2011_GWE1_48_7]|uniref:Pseudouridine synthase n=2 Tax=Candidatus Wolfeibacteriota TaxID=1752735 RepID=A0A0G1U804_9BACT|nr:MAG: Ribosomal large subunit pseudouridine synthase F [Candidatus Wolfebacteria bacterium GW2011_GWC2_46_275]KKU42603.1 MAG: Ribosomal large subunit pseudouridine synthase F [Candidatus Wolfebacteria bacterium GW2011_GWB2_46_69]KKU54662.1 MAG: Ribosomal large subunit pseudouridine synthase F [Candidatus Wolfebacteria bacterium GW2011_GWC1_47_103]KKU59167.1 MAG: Ribosomal large subunit pseudouridine synthase F [Candidatus Wolfebacteria bacterium GW2011_GWE2_47_12]KKU66454.1 MAG: Ribosomal lar